MKKQFETPERCLAEMVEHCWEIYNPNQNTSCLVMHSDGHCDWNDPVRKCVHCPAKQRLRIQQSEVKEWL